MMKLNSYMDSKKDRWSLAETIWVSNILEMKEVMKNIARVIIILSWLLSVIQLSSEVKNYKSPCSIPSSGDG